MGVADDKFVRVEPAELTSERLDTGFYSPEYYASLTAVRKSGLKVTQVGWLCEPWCFGAYALTNLIQWATEADGVPYFKAESLDPPLVNHAGLSFITAASHRSLPRSRVTAGDIVVSTSGTVGRVCVVPKSIPEANSNQDTIKFNPSSEEIDNHYVAAFLNSRFGQTFMSREAGGSVQQHIYLHNFKRLPLVLPDRRAQTYIGAKIRLAEALREQARAARGVARAFVEDAFTAPQVPTFLARPRRVVAKDVSAVSLDPEFARAEAGHRLMEGSIPISEVVSKCESGDPIRADARRPGPYPYYGASGPIDVHDDWNFDGEFVVAAQDGSVGCASVARGRFWANNHVWVLTVKPEYDADAVAYFLRSHYPYWSGLTTGSVIPKVTSENLLRVHVPVRVAQASAEVGRPMRVALARDAEAAAIIAATRSLVDALVDRNVTEAELIAAASNPAADRDLLARLTTGGLDAPGEALFPDLDALARLLSHEEPAP